MARLPILEHPDPRLREHARAVEHFDGDLTRLIDDLLETLQATGGIGLAAPQVGQALQVVVMDCSGSREAPEVFINPELLHCSDTRVMVEESCLSLPGITGNVPRALAVRVRARDRHGRLFERGLQNLPAVCLQHEMDHLVGTLFVDRLSFFQRLALRARGRAKPQRDERVA